MRVFIPIYLLVLLDGCRQPVNKPFVNPEPAHASISYYKTTGEIEPPGGFTRIPVYPGSFAAWLRKIPLKKNKTVYLYNRSVKPNQSAQFAVVDIPAGKKDLQQCADVAMRLRAEYLFASNQYSAIAFIDFNGKQYKWQGSDNRKQFEQYLENVFGWCGSASLEKQLRPVNNIYELQAGDVFIKGGFPGHAMTVLDVAINNKGKKVFMLVQGYQPAQDIHIVINPMNNELSPWYEVIDAEQIITPEWIFYKNQLKSW